MTFLKATVLIKFPIIILKDPQTSYDYFSLKKKSCLLSIYSHPLYYYTLNTFSINLWSCFITAQCPISFYPYSDLVFFLLKFHICFTFRVSLSHPHCHYPIFPCSEDSLHYFGLFSIILNVYYFPNTLTEESTLTFYFTS